VFYYWYRTSTIRSAVITTEQAEHETNHSENHPRKQPVGLCPVRDGR
jgi:hypothetical protein